MLKQVKRKRHINKKLKTLFQKNVIVSIIIMGVLSIGVCVFAKYFKNYKLKTVVQNTPIATYYIDLVNEDKTTSFTQNVLLKDLNPGDERDVVFYVRNGYEKDGTDIISDVNIEYDISITHTNNLPLEYQLLDENNQVLIPESDISDTSEPYLNMGEKMSYNSNNDGDKFVLYKSDTDIQYHKYVLKISWDESFNDSSFIKEVDAIYFKVNSFEERPVHE